MLDKKSIEILRVDITDTILEHYENKTIKKLCKVYDSFNIIADDVYIFAVFYRLESDSEYKARLRNALKVYQKRWDIEKSNTILNIINNI